MPVSQLGGALAQVDNDMRIRFLQHTRVLNPNFVRLLFLFPSVSGARVYLVVG